MDLCCVTLGIVIAIVAGVLCSLYVPVPPGTSLSGRLPFTVMRAMDRVGTVLEWAGITDRLVVLKALMTKASKPAPNQALLYAEVQSEDTEYEGIPVRIFTPNDKTSDAAVVWLHGGGYCVGTLDLYDEICRKIAFDMGGIVMSVGYRLAPQHPFPACIDDCVAATKYFLKNTARYGVNPEKVAVMGDSAGGNLSAAVALVLRDEKFSPALKAQVLIYPVCQGLDFTLPSYEQNSRGPILTSGMMAAFDAQYAAGDAGATYDVTEKFRTSKHVPADVMREMAASKLNRDLLPERLRPRSVNFQEGNGDAELWKKVKDVVLDQRYSPLLADDLSNLPPAYIFTAELDVLRDEGIMFKERLRQAGNDVTWSHDSLGYHGVISTLNIKQIERVRKEYERMIVFLKEKLV